MNLTNQISEAELEVMKILWREGQPVPFSDIRRELSQKMGWEKSTIATLLRRLQKKSAVSAEEREVNYYRANISKEEYAREKEKNIIDKLYEGSAKQFVAALCHRGELTEEDIDELKMYFQKLGNSEK